MGFSNKTQLGKNSMKFISSYITGARIKILLSAFHILTHFILTNLQNHTDEETEVR